ncbi:MAG: ABC transporter permease [Bdellovibrionota bacterium]
MTKRTLKQKIPQAALYLWIAFFVASPLVLTFVLSFFSRNARGGFSSDLTLHNVLQLFDATYISILFKSLRLASLTAFLCALFGFPIAYVIATSTPKKKLYYYALLLIPFWTNFIVRTQALRQLFSPAGLDLALSPTVIIQIGMLMNYLPLFVLPCAVAIERLPASVWEAASDLGARRPSIWIKIILPMLKKPLIHGSLMVFVPALGEFVIPDILGGAQGFYLGGLISEQFLKARNWPFGAALSLLLLLSAALIVFLQKNNSPKDIAGEVP